MAIGAALILTASGCRHTGVGQNPILGNTRVPGKQEAISESGSKDNGRSAAQRPPVRPTQSPIFTPVSPEPPVITLTQSETPPSAATPGTNLDFEGSAKYDGVFQNHTEDPNIFAPYTVYFELDSSVIRSDEGPKLENIAQYFATNKTDVLMVEGHCDERGTEQYNMALGDRRALAVREYLIKLGVENTRIRTVSYGESRPVDPRHNEAAWKKNRRGFSLLYKAVGEPQK